MFTTFINAFKIKDLRKKILYTLLLLVVYRLGSAIPIPGVDAAAWAQQIEGLALFDFMSLLSGSALSQFTLFAMGISPYITASIIMQLLAIAIPSLEKMSKEEDGRKKIEKITRYVGVALTISRPPICDVPVGCRTPSASCKSKGSVCFVTLGSKISS